METELNNLKDEDYIQNINLDFEFPSLKEFMKATASIDKGIKEIGGKLDSDEVFLIEFEIKTGKTEYASKEKSIVRLMENLHKAPSYINNDKNNVLKQSKNDASHKISDKYVTAVIEKKGKKNLFPIIETINS